MVLTVAAPRPLPELKNSAAMAWLRSGAQCPSWPPQPTRREPWQDPGGALTASPGAHGQRGCPQDRCDVLLAPSHLTGKVQLNRQKRLCPATWKYNSEPGDTGLGGRGQKGQRALGLMDETQLCPAQLSGFGEITSRVSVSPL